ncbi:hypothetical protein [Flavobacterium sp.]|uniref:hypothetical protein n=1 Tax=Flavobacterium sp. TaxID=239 RepID=UPI00374D489E
MNQLYEINITKLLNETIGVKHVFRYFVLASSKTEALKKVDINNSIDVLIKRICNESKIIK